MKRKFESAGMFSFVFVLACAVTSTGEVRQVDTQPVALSVAPHCTASGRCTLRLTLHNNATTPLRLYEDLLPWRRYGMVVSVVDINTGQSLKEIRHLEDPDAELVTLQPGETLSGTLDLNQRFPDLPSALTTTDVACFWAYKPRGELSRPLAAVVGGIVLGKAAH